ncbi:MAG: alpha/beta fold hydrolase [Deltaproteobacteria bacterium]|nr:MAG: alpha/beta fold hydrolase [Deltaproteobacteria bacterium]
MTKHQTRSEIETIFVQAGGLEFEVDTCGEGEKFAICLHGFPEHAFSWRYQLPLLARLGYTVWAPNLRGYGLSSRPKGVRNYALDLLMGDVTALIEAAGGRDRETLLIGHDWGGAIAWGIVIEKRARIDRFIVMNMPHPAIFLRKVWRLPQLLRSWYILFFQLPWLPEKLLCARGARAVGNAFRQMARDERNFSSEVLSVYRYNALQPGAMTAMLNYYRAIVRVPPSAQRLRGFTRPVDTPTLMIWGTADQALGKELTFGTEAFVSDLTLRYLPGVSHWVQQEAPEAVNAMIEAWLTGQEVPSSFPSAQEKE